MVLVLQDGEELRGTIEWYDRNCIKLHRTEGANLLVLKHNVKYIFKDESKGSAKQSDNDAEENVTDTAEDEETEEEEEFEEEEEDEE